MDIQRKKAMVRVLTESLSLQGSGLLETVLNDFFEATEIIHILAVCELVNKHLNKPSNLPDFSKVFDTLSAWQTEIVYNEENGLSKNLCRYEELALELSVKLKKLVTYRQINEAIESLCESDELRYFYTESVFGLGTRFRLPRLSKISSDFVDYPVKDKSKELIEAIKKILDNESKTN